MTPRPSSKRARLKLRRLGGRIRPGTILERAYGGKTYVVEVLDQGFRFNGQVWGTLSLIAREITGTRWNGPRFFGLRAPGA